MFAFIPISFKESGKCPTLNNLEDHNRKTESLAALIRGKSGKHKERGAPTHLDLQDGVFRQNVCSCKINIQDYSIG